MFFKRVLKNIDYIMVFIIALILSYALLIIGTAKTSTEWVSKILVQKGIEENILEYLWQAGIWKRLSLINMHLVEKQLIWIILGFLLMSIIIYISYEIFSRHCRQIYILNLMLLASVLFLGYEAMGAQRWIHLGPFAFQPSEFSKVLFIISLAGFLSSRVGYLDRLRDLLPCFAYVGVPTLLIIMQPDLGTSLVFIAIMFGMLYAAGARPALLGGILGSAVTLAVGSVWAHFKFGTWVPLQDYQLQRLTIFLDPWKDLQGAGYHMIQSQIAIGSSGFTGKGILRGTQSLGQYVPIPESDFIFAVLSEQLGFLGALLLLTLYIVLLFRILNVAMNAKDTFGMLLSVGVASMFVFHVLVNAGMTIGIMPVTGLPLPLFSYGGSNMIANLLALGLVFNVQLRKQKIMF
ncbi:MAG: rod shape-determining protein RodA [Clostridiales bacterium]|nr:rod shape-determining protein RodA [Clostridiales bacterium]MCF8022283.1 rod shape-determining protein RodA [Clostridiales bacterium]